MRTKILVLASVALAAAALGVAGARIASQEPVQTASAQGTQALDDTGAKAMSDKKAGHPCDRVLKRLERGPIDDAGLRKILNGSPRCRSTILDVASPAQAARVITVQAPPSTSGDEVPAVTRQDDDVFEEEDDDGPDDDHGDDDSDENSGFSADTGTHGEDDHSGDD